MALVTLYSEDESAGKERVHRLWEVPHPLSLPRCPGDRAGPKGVGRRGQARGAGGGQIWGLPFQWEGERGHRLIPGPRSCAGQGGGVCSDRGGGLGPILQPGFLGGRGRGLEACDADEMGTSSGDPTRTF